MLLPSMTLWCVCMNKWQRRRAVSEGLFAGLQEEELY